MICTSTIPCLSSGFAKGNEIMSLFVLFPAFLKVWLFSKMGGQTLHQSSQTRMLLVNFSKVQQLSNNFQRSAAILTKKVRTNLTAETYRRLSQKKTFVFVEKNCGFMTVFWGQR